MSEHIGEAVWTGGLKDGKGQLSVESQGFNLPYGYDSRFGEGKGTNPEELIGAAHAGCFSMSLASLLEKAGHPPQDIKTQAHVKLEKTDKGLAITQIRLVTEARVPGMKESDFQATAIEAKANCPVSKALAGVKIEMTAALRTDQC
jgi:osmotically inducible protein OsmC